jgi:hypothetical protein
MFTAHPAILSALAAEHVRDMQAGQVHATAVRQAREARRDQRHPRGPRHPRHQGGPQRLAAADGSRSAADRDLARA